MKLWLAQLPCSQAGLLTSVHRFPLDEGVRCGCPAGCVYLPGPRGPALTSQVVQSGPCLFARWLFGVNPNPVCVSVWGVFPSHCDCRAV